ncbi:MAG: L,D-transpeptidase family protein [Sulfuricaulis sp.]
MQRYKITAAAIIAVSISNFCFIGDVYSRAITQAFPQVDHVVVRKAAHTLALMRNGRVIKTYKISLGREPVGPKEKAGDERTPEGDYILDWRNPNSKFYLALHISYPNAEERSRAERGGYAPGGDIMIHGRPNWTGWIRALYKNRDWTDGCIAVSNAAIKEIWQAVPDGTPITILP